MRIRTKVVIGLTAAALVSGCASSGGSGKVTNADGTASTMTGEDFLLCLLTAGLACGGEASNAKIASASTVASSTTSGTSSVASSWQPPATFSSWSGLDRSRESMAPAIWSGFSWGGTSIVSVWTTGFQEYQENFLYDAQGELVSIGSFSESHKRFVPLNHAGIDVRHSASPYFAPSPFTSLPARNVGAFANPLALGWDYQSFGAWSILREPGTVTAVTFGAPTPGASVPTVGSATFTGKLAGFYVSSTGTGHIAAADLTVHANFATRTLDLGSSGTTLTRDIATGMAAPHLNVSGTLSYASGSSMFSGNLTSAGGTMSGNSQGRFYGPAAQELGGVFTLKSATTPETFAGAYGAKR